MVEGWTGFVAVHKLLHQQLVRNMSTVRGRWNTLSKSLVHHEVRGRRRHPFHGGRESGGREVEFGDATAGCLYSRDRFGHVVKPWGASSVWHSVSLKYFIKVSFEW